MTLADREGLARTGHAEQRLMAIAGLDRLEQLGDRLPLVAARFVIRFELKRHRALSLNERNETTNRDSVACGLGSAQRLQLQRHRANARTPVQFSFRVRQ